MAVYLRLFLCCLIPLCFKSVQAQVDTEPLQAYLEAPLLQSLSSDQKPRAIQVKSYYLSPRGTKRDVKQVQSFVFDSLGNLVQQIEMQADDTIRVRDYHYTQKGVLFWEIDQDKTFSRSYKKLNRFNSDKTILQTKNYEILNNKSQMLVDTRRYLYNEKGETEQILRYTNGEVTSKISFTYNENGKLAEKILADVEGKATHTISFSYDKAARLVAVKRIVHNRPPLVEEFDFIYNEKGWHIETVWKENGQIKSSYAYEYDENGKLLKANETLQKAKQPLLIKEFEYVYSAR